MRKYDSCVGNCLRDLFDCYKRSSYENLQCDQKYWKESRECINECQEEFGVTFEERREWIEKQLKK